ncbi:ribokinase [Runella sp.]|jgi:ribokinase|uniref:ribokinase n=1 Tax=Runella sp. TaxID=1960881 RepID=UPI002610B99C|nr:ribokinase [Runella sp.]
MKILNFGSVNVDYVYGVDHFVKPSETLASQSYDVFMGGKGCNQSVALAKAGAEVYHAGNIGKDGLWIKEQLEKWGVNTDFLQIIDGPTGHAIIQVVPEGQNAIIIHGGANRTVTPQQIDQTLNHFGSDDWLLFQNEINCIPELIEAAFAKGMKIIFNPAPMTSEVASFPLNKIDVFIINEVEGQELTQQTSPADILQVMTARFPNAATLLTLGEKGAVYSHQNTHTQVEAQRVKTIDTTAAGDTFIGYFLASQALGLPLEESLNSASKAAAICVTRKGGAISIPNREEV